MSVRACAASVLHTIDSILSRKHFLIMIHILCNQNGFINAIERGRRVHQMTKKPKTFVAYIVSLYRMHAIRITNFVCVRTSVVIIATKFISKLRAICFSPCVDHYMLSQQHQQYLFEGIKINLNFLFLSFCSIHFVETRMLSSRSHSLVNAGTSNWCRSNKRISMWLIQCMLCLCQTSCFNAINTQFDSESHKYTPCVSSISISRTFKGLSLFRPHIGKL